VFQLYGCAVVRVGDEGKGGEVGSLPVLSMATDILLI
jgi:hypothetical protein